MGECYTDINMVNGALRLCSNGEKLSPPDSPELKCNKSGNLRGFVVEASQLNGRLYLPQL